MFLHRVMNIPRIELRAAIVSLVTGFLLLAIKFSAYWITDSSAIFSDALESIVNVLAAVIAFWALAVAHTPADMEHPYGHGKIEFMSAALEGGMILLASVVILFRAIEVFTGSASKVAEIDIGLFLIIMAMLVNGAVGWMLIRTGKRQHSATLEADGHHLLSDAITSVAVIIGLLIVKITGWIWADPICAILISIYIAWLGIRLVNKSLAGLMDRQDLDDSRNLEDLLNTHIGENAKEPRICSFHKLRHRHSGRYHWVDFHIMVPPTMDIAEAHRIASTIEFEIELMLGEGDATAHVEPCSGDGGCDLCCKKQLADQDAMSGAI